VPGRPDSVGPVTGDRGQRGTPPHPQRLVQRRGPVDIGVSGVLAALDQAGESMKVDRVRIDLQDISRTSPGNPGGRVRRTRLTEKPAYPAHVRIEDVACFDGRLIAPDPVDESVDRNRATGVDRQRGKHGLLAGRTDVESLVRRL